MPRLAALPSSPQRISLADLPISRRGFLQRSAGLGAVLALSGCVGGSEESYRALLPAGELPATLAVREYAVLRAVVQRMVPGGERQPGAGELRVALRVDHELGLAPAHLRHDFRDALRLVEWWPLVTRFSRFTRLSPGEQDAELSGMQGSRFAARRSAFQGLKFVTMFLTYAHASRWPLVGYDGPWVPRGPLDTLREVSRG